MRRYAWTMATQNDHEDGLATRRIHAWHAALRKVARVAPELVSASPARWRWHVGSGLVVTTLVEPGGRSAAGLAIEIPGASQTWNALVVLPRAQVPDRLSAASEGLTGLLLTGDPVFDDEVAVLSSEAAAYGLFDADGRALVRAVIAAGAVVLAGVVQVSASAQPASIPPLLDKLLALREALAATTEQAERRVSEIASDDPVAAVRARYRGLSRVEPFRRHQVERAINDGAADTLAALGAHVADETQSLTLRRVALQRLLSQHPLASVAAVDGAPWRDFESDDELLLSFAAALRKQTSAGDAHAALAIARRLYRDLALSHPIVATQLMRLLPLCYDLVERRRAFLGLGRHLTVTIAAVARDGFLASYEDHGLSACADGGQIIHDVIALPELAQEILRRARDVLEIAVPASDEAATARAAVRRIVQHLKPVPVDPFVASIVPAHDEWPAESLALPFIAAHRAARDPDGLTFLTPLLADGSPEVHRAALLALLELRPTPENYWALREHVLLSDLLAAAVDPSTPREALAYVLAHVPNGKSEPLLVQFLSTLEHIGGAAEIPLVARLLDNGAKATIIAALRTLGAIGDGTIVQKIEAHAGGFFRDSDIKAAARAALAAIALRGAPRGSLSLVEGGGLALSEGDDS